MTHRAGRRLVLDYVSCRRPHCELVVGVRSLSWCSRFIECIKFIALAVVVFSGRTWHFSLYCSNGLRDSLSSLKLWLRLGLLYWGLLLGNRGLVCSVLNLSPDAFLALSGRLLLWLRSLLGRGCLPWLDFDRNRRWHTYKCSFTFFGFFNLRG